MEPRDRLQIFQPRPRHHLTRPHWVQLRITRENKRFDTLELLHGASIFTYRNQSMVPQQSSLTISIRRLVSTIVSNSARIISLISLPSSRLWQYPLTFLAFKQRFPPGPLILLARRHILRFSPSYFQWRFLCIPWVPSSKLLYTSYYLQPQENTQADEALKPNSAHICSSSNKYFKQMKPLG